MKIGRVDLPALSIFDNKPTGKGVEDVTLTGTLYKDATYPDALDHQKENIKSLKPIGMRKTIITDALGLNSAVITNNKAAENYINYSTIKGFLAVDNVNLPKDANTKNIREIQITGKFCPEGLYKRQLSYNNDSGLKQGNLLIGSGVPYDFEDGADAGTPDKWTNSGLTTMELDTAIKHSGSQSFKLVGDGTGDYAHTSITDVLVTPNTLYMFEGFIMNDNAGEDAKFGIQYYKQDGSTTTGSEFTATRDSNADQWHYLSVVAYAPFDAKYAQLRLYPGATAAGTAWIDDLSFGSISNEWEIEGRPIMKVGTNNAGTDNKTNVEGGIRIYDGDGEDGSTDGYDILSPLVLHTQQWDDDLDQKFGDVDANGREGFYFQLPSDYDNLIKIDVRLDKTSSPEHLSNANAVDTFNDIIFELWETASNLPIGTALASYTLPVNKVTTTLATVSAWFNAFGLTGGNTYAVTMRKSATDAVDASNYYMVRANNNAADQIPDSGEIGYTTSTTTWAATAGTQLLFRAYSLPKAPAIAWDEAQADGVKGDVTIWDTNGATEITATHLDNKYYTANGTDDFSKVFSKEHKFTSSSGLLVIENGLIALTQVPSTGKINFYAYYGSAWNDLGVFDVNIDGVSSAAEDVDDRDWENITVEELTPDYVKLRIDYAKTASAAYDVHEILEMWAGKPWVKRTVYNDGVEELVAVAHTLTHDSSIYPRFAHTGGNTLIDSSLDSSTNDDLSTSDDNMTTLLNTTDNVLIGVVQSETERIRTVISGSNVTESIIYDGTATAKRIKQGQAFAPHYFFAIPLTTSALLVDLDDVERGSGDALASGEDLWTEATTRWTGGGSGDGTISVDSGTAQVGTNSIAHTRNATGGLTTIQTPASAIDVSEYKSIEAWLESDNGANEAVTVKLETSSGNDWTSTSTTLPAAGTFGKFVRSLPTATQDMGWTKTGSPDITSIASITFTFTNGSDTTGECRVDGLNFSRIVDASDNVVGGPVVGHWGQHSNANYSGGEGIASSITYSVQADGDELRLTDVNIPATGRYKIFYGGTKQATHGIADLHDDDDQDGTKDAQIGSIDNYAGSTEWGRYEIADCWLTSGNHDFYLKVDGKNASSSSYTIALDYLLFTPYSNDENWPLDIAKDCMRTTVPKLQLKQR